jgi:hypothetical protein
MLKYNRVPMIQDERKPWTYRGWLAHYLFEGFANSRMVGNPSPIALRQSCPLSAHHMKRSQTSTKDVISLDSGHCASGANGRPALTVSGVHLIN